ncbi:type III secretion protein [Pseudomonas sp. FP2309]|uniref:type III secretion protein n=1 Tax=Pseudomonas sp. FP2309 TaxID=2954091 RepID=UPI0027356D98|nr:type III secretion protein [Pseudomonas sp. FP2309]WLH70343.1 type III secretion protein [Pseudomonas sp. FP2309]
MLASIGQVRIGKRWRESMTIEGALPHVRPLALDGPALRTTAPAPAASAETLEAPYSERPIGEPRRPLQPRASVSVLHHRALQNLPAARANLPPPGATSTDSQLATALEKAFGLLHPFISDGRLTWSSLQRIGAQPQGESEERDRAIQVVGEILKRPRLSDAILSRDGYITRDSLRGAAQALQGNSSPGVFSQDPFHVKSNAHVVQALQGQFEQLRDRTQDRTYLFEQHQYVEIATLKTVMQDPYAVDQQGVPVLDPFTGMPRPRYSEFCVYTAKNIVERPGLLSALERANATRLFGPFQKDGWLSNKSLERWLEQDEAYKAR